MQDEDTNAADMIALVDTALALVETPAAELPAESNDDESPAPVKRSAGKSNAVQRAYMRSLREADEEDGDAEAADNYEDEDDEDEEIPVKKSPKKSLKKKAPTKKGKVVATVRARLDPAQCNRVTDAMLETIKKRGFDVVIDSYHNSINLPLDIFKRLGNKLVRDPNGYYYTNYNYPVQIYEENPQEPYSCIRVTDAEKLTAAFKLMHEASLLYIPGKSGTRISGNFDWSKADWLADRTTRKLYPQALHWCMTKKMFIMPYTITDRTADSATLSIDATFGRIKGDALVAWTTYLESFLNNPSVLVKKSRYGSSRPGSRSASHMHGLRHPDVVTKVFVNNYAGKIHSNLDGYDKLSDGTETYKFNLGNEVDAYLCTGVVSSIEHLEKMRVVWNEKQYIKECVAELNKQITPKITQQEESVRELEQSLLAAAMSLGKLREQKKMTTTAGKAMLLERIQAMTAMPNIESYTFSRKGVLFTTREIWSEPRAAVPRDHVTAIPSKFLGKYEIAFDLKTGRLIFRNVMQTGEVACTPQTGKDKICLGSYRSIVAEALATNDYEALLGALLQYLHDTHLSDGTALRNFNTEFKTEKPKETKIGAWVYFTPKED